MLPITTYIYRNLYRKLYNIVYNIVSATVPAGHQWSVVISSTGLPVCQSGMVRLGYVRLLGYRLVPYRDRRGGVLRGARDFFRTFFLTFFPMLFRPPFSAILESPGIQKASKIVPKWLQNTLFYKNGRHAIRSSRLDRIEG